MDEAAQKYPIARWLGIAVSVVMILSWMLIVIGPLIIGFGMAAHMSGGELHMPFGTISTDTVSMGGFIIAFAVLVAIMPWVIFICDQLRRILATLAEGEPFVPENAGRLVRIAIAVAAMELSRYAVVLFGMHIVRGDETLEPPRLVLNLAAWIGVAVLFVLSQVFREGTRLREEEKMTI